AHSSFAEWREDFVRPEFVTYRERHLEFNLVYSIKTAPEAPCIREVILGGAGLGIETSRETPVKAVCGHGFPPHGGGAVPVCPPSRSRTPKAARRDPGGWCGYVLALPRGFVDARLIALTPGAGDRDPGLLGEGADEAPDDVLLPACGVHNLLQRGAAGADQQVAHDCLLAELAWHPRRAGVRRGRGLVGRNLGCFAVRELLDRLERVVAGGAGEAVPDFDQAADRPLGGGLAEFLLAGKHNQ